MRQSRIPEVGEIRGLFPNQLMVLEGNLFFFSCFPKYFSYMKMRNKARNEDMLSSPIELCAIHSRQDKGNDF